MVDIDGNPYPDLTRTAAVYNANIYYHKLGQPAAQLEPPTPLSPMYDAPVFSSTTRFAWRPVVGAASYLWQAAQTPDFASPLSTTTSSVIYTPTVGSLDAGRWYWRVRASSAVSDELAYTAPQPFDVLSQTHALMINGFENSADTSIDGPNSKWSSWEVSGSLTLTGTTVGRTEGQQAGLLTFTGKQSPGRDEWVEISRAPNGNGFSPSDWRGYDYLTLDINSLGSDIPAPLFTMSFSDDANAVAKDAQVLTIRQGVTNFFMPLNQAWGVDLSHIQDLKIGGRRPLTGTQLVVDNLTLRAVDHPNLAQPPITPTLSDAMISGTLLLDWSNYHPARTTTTYLVYISDNPNTSISSMQPILTLDAVAQQARLRVQLNLSAPSADPSGFAVLPNGQPFYATVVPVDLWGNVGAVGPSASASPSECGLSFSDVPYGSWAWANVNHLACLNIVNGTSSHTFSPNAPATRVQFAKMVSLAQGWPLVTPTNPTFSDVPPANPLYSFVETAYANGAISGASSFDCAAQGLAYPCFLPNDNITRAQIAIITVRAFGWPIDTTGGPHFSDVSADNYAYGAIETCYHRGTVTGIGGGLFAPNANVTRAQLAVILYKALTLP